MLNNEFMENESNEVDFHFGGFFGFFSCFQFSWVSIFGSFFNYYFGLFLVCRVHLVKLCYTHMCNVCPSSRLRTACAQNPTCGQILVSV